jgi:hypothetical protein
MSNVASTIRPPATLRTPFDSLIALAVLFPYVGIVPGIDTQPNFALVASVAVFLMLLLRQNQGVGRTALLLFSMLLLLVAARLLFGENAAHGRYVATYVLALVVPFLMWYLVWRGNVVAAVRRLIWFAISMYAGVGIIQLLILPEFLGFMVTRSGADVETITNSGRGVRSLASEPAALGIIFSYINVLYVYCSLWPNFNFKRARKASFMSLILFGATLLISQSAYAVAIHFILLVIFFLCVDRRALFYTATLLSLVSIPLFLSEWLEGRRLLIIGKAFFSLDFNYLMSQGAFARLMNVPMSIHGGLAMFPMGFGNSDVTVHGSFKIFGSEYAYEIGNRNLGGLVEWFLRFGVIGLMILGLYFYALWRIAKMRSWGDGLSVRLGIFLSLAVFLLTFFYGSTTNPMAWFTFFLIFQGAMTNQSRRRSPFYVSRSGSFEKSD